MDSQIEYTKRIHLPHKHLFESATTYSLYDDDFVNLTAGAPGPELLEQCCTIFQVATRHRLEQEVQDKSLLFQYGPCIGRHDFRSALATFLTDEYQNKVHCEDLVLTTGATQGLHLILSTLVDFSGVIFVDEVTYMIALKAIGQFPTLTIVSVPLTKYGVDTVQLRRLVQQYRFASTNKLFWGVYYTMTIHHNPTGLTFSNDVCQDLIRISRDLDLLVLSEDVYNLLTYTGETPPQRLFAMDNMTDADYKGNVISNGTFSKILAPGVRVGWMECPPRCANIFHSESGILRSGGATNNYTAGIVTSLIQLGLVKQQLCSNLVVYKDRMKVACETLRQNLPNDCVFVEPTGGYFIWIEFPADIDVNAFNNFSKSEYLVGAIAGSDFSAESRFGNCMRVSIAFHNADKIRTSLLRLCEAYKVFLAKVRWGEETKL